jgi:superoxide dismutase
MELRNHINLVEASTRPAKLETTPLPYGEKDLAPVLSKESLEYHYGHLAKGYAKRYNAGEGNADFNRAGSFLHNKFFPQLRPVRGANRPRGAVLALIEEKFKTYEDFKEAVQRNCYEDTGLRLGVFEYWWRHQNHCQPCCAHRYMCAG